MWYETLQMTPTPAASSWDDGIWRIWGMPGRAVSVPVCLENSCVGDVLYGTQTTFSPSGFFCKNDRYLRARGPRWATIHSSTHNTSSICLPTPSKFLPPALRSPHRQEIPQQTSHQQSKLPQANPEGVKSLLRYRQIAEKMRPGPPEPTKPVVQIPGWRWTANWTGERRWGICMVLAMLFVLFALADQGLPAVTGCNLSVALDVLRPTMEIDELMDKCALGTKLPLQMVIGRHIPAIAVEGMIFQLSSAEIDVIGLKKTDNGLENEVSQGSAILDETPLGPGMQINENLLNSATLITSSKVPESGYPEKSIAMMEEVDTRQIYAFDVAHGRAYGSKDLLPFAATKYNQTPEVACCLPAVDRCIHLELLNHNACGRLPDAGDHVSATTVHMSWFCPSHRDGYLKSQQAVTSNRQWHSLGAHLKIAGNRGIVGIVIPDQPEEDGPAEAPENARSPPKLVSGFCCMNVTITTALHAATGDVGSCSSHKHSDLKANQIIGNSTWLISPVEVRSGQIGRWFFRFLDKSAIVGSQWKLTLWKLAGQITEAMLPRGTAQHDDVQASMTWREETGSSQSLRFHPTQVTSAMKHNYDKYPPSKNRFKEGCKGKAMHETQVNEASHGWLWWMHLGRRFLDDEFRHRLPKRVLLGL
ncbi:hypothetical protein BU17DRAFT_70706 [Hysterangium stoloniferum]|nr:hypothetical protein BU17DRAFT_70706 [Hysterangium stoloniferum]